MKEHDATEIAFKNGYKQCAMDVLEEIEEYTEDVGFSSFMERWKFNDFLAELKKKYTEKTE